MPELPEVETMVRDLRRRLTGGTIAGAAVYWGRIVAHPDRRTFEKRLRNRRIEGIERRGKYALFRLDGGSCLAVHRGMTGSLLLRPKNFPDDRFVRARFRLEDGAELRLDDARKFGRLFYVEDARPDVSTTDGGPRDDRRSPLVATNGSTPGASVAVLPPTDSQTAGKCVRYQPPWERLGLEPLSDAFGDQHLAERFSGRRVAIKTALLNQRIVAGIGNIYADESLFVARVHPARPAGSLSLQEIGRLRAAVCRVLLDAIGERGTTFSTYRDIDGSAGANQSKLLVFHRHGQACFRCGNEIRRTMLGGRGTHFCPVCQT